MTTITQLSALGPDNPVAWMAACGALRLLPAARLRWRDGTPELACDDDPVATIAAQIPARAAAPEIRFAHKLSAGMKPQAWADLRDLPGEWALAMARQTEQGAQGTQLRIGAGGNYHMAGMAADILKRLDALAETERCDKVREALLGPWRYADAGLFAWGWDAAARIDPAGIACKAEDLGKHNLKPGVLGAYWLGWEALPLFPIINGRTRGWHPRHGMTYVTWDEWLDYPDLAALLLALEQMPSREQRALGIRHWRAAYLKTHISSGRLGWAVPVARTPSDGARPGDSRKRKGLTRLVK